MSSPDDNTPASTGSGLTVLGVIVSFVLFFLGLFLLGNAADVAGAELICFFGGIVSIALALAFAVHVLPWLEKR